jgi:hypothetical protein
MVHVLQTKYFLDVDDSLWNQLFDNELPKYMDRLDFILFCTHHLNN